MFDKYIGVVVVLLLCFNFIIPMGIAGAQGMAKSDQNMGLTLQTPKFAYVGSFTTADRDGRGTGIEVFSIDSKTGVWTRIQSVEDISPGFLAMDRQKEFLYVGHGGGTVVSAYAIDQESGKLTLVNQQPTGGKNGAHLVVDPSGEFLLVANNTSGDVTVLPIREDGSLAAFSDLVTLPGKIGTNRSEQASSHPHQVSFDPSGKFVLVSDVGLDKVFVYRLDTSTGKLLANDFPSVATRAGAGPRHFAFHPSKPYTYVINGLDSTIATYQFDSGRGELKPIQVMPALPTTFVGDSNASEVMVTPSGKFAYGATRGSNAIGVFAIDQGTGILAPIEWVSTQGKGPRFFTLDPSGAYLYVGNLSSDTIVIFSINQLNGTLVPTGQVVKTGSPSCIVFR